VQDSEHSRRSSQTMTHRSLLGAFLFLFTSLHVNASQQSAPNSEGKANGPIISTSSISKRFSFNPLLLTVTLKDPFIQNDSSPKIPKVSLSSSEDENESSVSKAKPMGRFNNLFSSGAQALGISSLSPSLAWSVRSTSPPLPNYFPQLKSTNLSVGYRYDDLKRAPSFYDGSFNLRSEKLGINMDVAPSYEAKTGKSAALIRVGSNRSNWFGFAKFGSVASTNKKLGLEFIRGFYKFNLPFSLVALSITPTFDFRRSLPSCNIKGTTASGRSAGVLDLNRDDPKIYVQHALDERNTIAPEISLRDARIMYNWNIALNSGSIRTRVDPLSAVQVTWTDQTPTGKWVTDYRLPLTNGRSGPLAGDLRVRRQFVF